MPDRMLIMTITIIASITTSLVFIIIYSLRKQKNQTKMLGELTRNNKQNNVYEGIEYNTHYFQGSKNSPPYFQIKFFDSIKTKFSLTLETGFDRFGKRIGLTNEILTGDLDFDSKYYINTEFQNFGYELFKKEKVRKIINEIFSYGFNILEADSKGLRVTIKPLKIKKELNNDLVEKIVSQLNEIKEECHNINVMEHDISDKKMKRNLIIGAAVLSSILGFAIFLIGMVNYKVLDNGRILSQSLIYSFLAYIIFQFISFWGLKGRSSSHKEMMVVIFTTLFGFFMLGWGTLLFMNGKLDKSEPIIYEQPVIKTYYTTNKNSKTYYAVVESWRGKSKEKIRINYRTYNSLEENDLLAIQTKAGHLGYEWITNYWIIENELNY